MGKSETLVKIYKSDFLVLMPRSRFYIFLLKFFLFSQFIKYLTFIGKVLSSLICARRSLFLYRQESSYKRREFVDSVLILHRIITCHSNLNTSWNKKVTISPILIPIHRTGTLTYLHPILAKARIGEDINVTNILFIHCFVTLNIYPRWLAWQRKHWT